MKDLQNDENPNIGCLFGLMLMLPFWVLLIWMLKLFPFY